MMILIVLIAVVRGKSGITTAAYALTAINHLSCVSVKTHATESIVNIKLRGIENEYKR